MRTRTVRKSKTTRFLEGLTGGPLTLGRLVAAIRLGEEAGLAEFAKTLGISKSHLCDIETGRKPVSATKAAEMARASLVMTRSNLSSSPCRTRFGALASTTT